jgi:lipoate-protein ligase A
MDAWRLIVTWGAAPDFNMGLDEALLESAESPPTLRLYTWRPDALSLGYFQRWSDVPGVERAGAVVRRITGGGAIHHVHELTYSLVAPLAHPVFGGTVSESYERIHRGIARGLRALGVEARPRGADPLESDRPGSGMCFHRSTPLDLAWGARKGVGSAQRRKGARVLHHGSIKLRPSPLDTGVAGLVEHAPGLTPQALGPLLVEALAAELGIAPRPAAPEASERELARQLARRYLDPGFVRRR